MTLPKTVRQIENCEENDCSREITIREHERDPQLGTAAAANVIEAVCPIHGIVNSA